MALGAGESLLFVALLTAAFWRFFSAEVAALFTAALLSNYIK